MPEADAYERQREAFLDWVQEHALKTYRIDADHMIWILAPEQAEEAQNVMAELKHQAALSGLKTGVKRASPRLQLPDIYGHVEVCTLSANLVQHSRRISKDDLLEYGFTTISRRERDRFRDYVRNQPAHIWRMAAPAGKAIRATIRTLDGQEMRPYIHSPGIILYSEMARQKPRPILVQMPSQRVRKMRTDSFLHRKPDYEIGNWKLYQVDSERAKHSH
jgi:hypothetical protein